MRKFINNILFSISKRLNWYHSMKTWSKYGDETRYHFNNPNIEIGDFTYGIPDVTIYDIGVKLKIGRYCSIAKDVRILLGGEHPVDHVSTYPFNKLKKYFPNAVSEFDPRKYDVSIGNDVWLGRGVTVLSGVTIGNGAVIGAGAVVSKNIPPYCIAVGNPIKILRKRFDEEKIRFLEENQWWNYTPKKINKILPIMQNINDYESRLNGGVKLSIIIVSYNTRDVTRECLKSIQEAEWRDTYEIIVVDNNSSDGSVNMIRSEFPDVIVIANSDNRFFAIANNQGASIAKGEYLLLLNSDTLVYGDNIQKMIDFFDSLPEDVICIGPKLLNRDKTLQACGFPLAFNPIKHTATLFGLDKIFPLYRLDSSFYRKPDKTHQTGWVTGACMMIPADKYAQVGGLNENLVFYGEEPEFGYRTSKCGYKTMYYADAEIIHLGGGSTKADKESRYSFEKDIQSYDSLISETVGAKRAITITRCTRFSLMIKWLFYKDKKYIASRINHEGRVIDYFKQKVKLSNDN